MGIFLLPGQLVNQYRLRAGGVKSESAGLFQDGSFSFPFAWKHKGFFSEIYCKNLVSFLEVKKKCEGPPVNDGTLRVFNSQICPHWASSSDSVNYPWGFPTSTLVSVVFCLSKPWLPVFASLFLQFWGKWFALCPQLSHRSKKSWFFSLFSCLLLRIEWWLPSSLHVKREAPTFFQNWILVLNIPVWCWSVQIFWMKVPIFVFFWEDW